MSRANAKLAVQQSCKKHFRPEFLNRLDDLVVFEPLQKSQLREVARLLTEELARRLTERNVAMQVSDHALDFAVKMSYDPLYGARPIRRWLVSAGTSALTTSDAQMISPSQALDPFCTRLRYLLLLIQLAELKILVLVRV